MRLFTALAGSLAPFALTAATPATACEATSVSAVVGFHRSGGQALVREEGPGIFLYPVDLKTGAKGDSIDIVTLDEQQEDTVKAKQLRGVRWKKAEADLTARGFVIAPDKSVVAKDGAVAKDVVIATEDRGVVDEDAGFYGGRLVASNGAGARVVLHEFKAPLIALPEYKPPTLSPDGKHFIVFLDGCGATVLVHSVDDVRAQLAAAATTTPAKKPTK